MFSFTSLNNFKLREKLNRNLPGILSSPVMRLCWRGKHTTGQTETALLWAVKTGRVLKPMSEQNQTSVFSAALHRSHLPATVSKLLYPSFQHFRVSAFSIYEHRSTYRKLPAFENLSELRVLLYFQDIYILLLYMRKDLQDTQLQERAITNSDNSLNTDSFYFLFCNDFPSNLL